MSNKNLLNENTVRRFMKLAEIEPLTDQFVGKLNESDVTEGQDRKDDDKDKGPIPKSAIDTATKKLEKLGKKTKQPVKEVEHDDKKVDGMVDEDIDLEERASFKDGDEGHDGMIDEELDALLAEMELDEADEADDDMADEADDELMGDEDEDDALAAAEDLGDEPMDAEPMMGGMDPEALRDMLKDVVIDALTDLAEEGAIEVTQTEPEDVEVKADMMGGPDFMGHMNEDDDAMVNEVARRVMRRIMNSRR